VGPGAIVAAAFIGPGTVTTATLAGANFGYSLLWALAFSIVATLVLQEMSARLGVVTGEGLGEAVRARFGAGLPRLVAVALIVSAIAIGNAAYEAGNLLGATLGMRGVAGGPAALWVPVFAGTAGALLWSGRYRAIERVLVAMVVLMSLVFLATAVVVAPPLREIVAGIVVPRADGPRAMLVALGLIGTTVVPYNLFLHAAAVRERWSGPQDLPAARLDLTVAIVLGGLISMAIVVTAAGALGGAGAAEGAAGGGGCRGRSEFCGPCRDERVGDGGAAGAAAGAVGAGVLRGGTVRRGHDVGHHGAAGGELCRGRRHGVGAQPAARPAPGRVGRRAAGGRAVRHRRDATGHPAGLRRGERHRLRAGGQRHPAAGHRRVPAGRRERPPAHG
jgi:hypothetical protein